MHTVREIQEYKHSKRAIYITNHPEQGMHEAFTIERMRSIDTANALLGKRDILSTQIES